MNQLVRASEADRDMGFMARLMALWGVVQRCLRNRRRKGQIALSEGKNKSLDPLDPIKAWIP